MKHLLVACLLFGLSLSAAAQKKKKGETPPPARAGVATAKADSAKRKPGLTPYRQFITAKAKTQKGLFTVHKITDDYYFEIPDTLLGRELIGVREPMLRAVRGKEIGLIFQEPMTALNPVLTVGFQINEMLLSHFDMLHCRTILVANGQQRPFHQRR